MKQRNGLAGFLRLGINPPYPLTSDFQSGTFSLTTPGQSMIKGVVREDDAQQAISVGFNAISVSNHGGRQLDGSPAPVTRIEPIRQAIGSDAQLVLDGGIRRGTDVLKALSLGADAVSFARPYLYGLAAAGAPGAVAAVEWMADAVKRDMVLAGVPDIASLNRSMVLKRS